MSISSGFLFPDDPLPSNSRVYELLPKSLVSLVVNGDISDWSILDFEHLLCNKGGLRAEIEVHDA